MNSNTCQRRWVNRIWHFPNHSVELPLIFPKLPPPPSNRLWHFDISESKSFRYFLTSPSNRSNIDESPLNHPDIHESPFNHYDISYFRITPSRRSNSSDSVRISRISSDFSESSWNFRVRVTPIFPNTPSNHSENSESPLRITLKFPNHPVEPYWYSELPRRLTVTDISNYSTPIESPKYFRPPPPSHDLDLTTTIALSDNHHVMFWNSSVFSNL